MKKVEIQLLTKSIKSFKTKKNARFVEIEHRNHYILEQR